MKPSNIPPFYVGQKVEAIEDHPQGAFKKAQKFTVKSVTLSCCSWQISIGISSKLPFNNCSLCKKVRQMGIEARFLASRFRPITESFQTVSFSKVVEEAMCGVN